MIAGIFKALGSFLRFVFTNGWKGAIAGVLAAALIIFLWIRIGGAITGAANPGASTKTPAATTAVDPGAPTVKQAPYQVFTDTRYYYAEKAVRNRAGSVIMTNYWALEGKKWVLKPSLTLDKDLYPSVKVIIRKSG